MEIRTKFEIGDEVSAIDYLPSSTFIKCEACKGKGYITLNRKRYPCPAKCETGKTRIPTKKEWKHIWTDRQIAIIQISRSKKIKYYFEGFPYFKFFPEADIFHTREAAENECKRRNLEEI